MSSQKPSWIGQTLAGRYKIETLLGQGRENSKTFLAENPGVLQELENLIRQETGLPVLEIPA